MGKLLRQTVLGDYLSAYLSRASFSERLDRTCFLGEMFLGEGFLQQFFIKLLILERLSGKGVLVGDFPNIFSGSSFLEQTFSERIGS